MRHAFLAMQRELPLHDQHGGKQVVQWHVFRDMGEADEFADHIMLGDDQLLVGGAARDSVGEFWWVGVEVGDLSHWGNLTAVNKHAA